MQPQYHRPYQPQMAQMAQMGHMAPMPPGRAPHAPQSNPRRGGIGPMVIAPGAGPHHVAPPSQHQLAQHQQAQHQAFEAAKRRSRKPTDKEIPDGVEEAILSDGVQRYRELRDFERRLDATMTRKRLDISDSVNRGGKRYKTMRVWISNTVEDQPWQGGEINIDSFDFSSNLNPTYRVKIEGRLLDDSEDDNADDDESDKDGNDDIEMDAPPSKSDSKTNPAGQAPRSRFSHFFRALNVDFDQSRLRHGVPQTVEWKKPERMNPANLPPAADFDEFTFRRNGDENMNITINLTRHEDPERFLLSPDLAEVVDMKEATRPEVVMGLWEYMKLRNLQEDEEKRNFRCDDLLRKVVGRDTGFIPQLQDYITPHLSSLPPLQLPYTIRVDEAFHNDDPQPTIYDIRVAVDDPLRTRHLSQLLHSPAYATMLREVGQLDDQLAQIVQAISASRAKHSFLTGLSEDPANFVRGWLSSQSRDLDVILGESVRGGGIAASGEEWHRGGKGSVWASQNAKESVTVLLAKPPGR